MVDSRKARRNAEKAAREALSGTLVGVAGDLGAAMAAREEAANIIGAAQTKAEAILATARREAAAVIEAAEGEAVTAREAYATAWTAAKDAGWTPAQLRSMGYDKPPTARKNTATRTATGSQRPAETASAERETAAADVA